MRTRIAALLLAIGLGLGLGLGWTTAARADEHILDFLSDITVQANGDMDVTEHIRVNAEGREITHGLLRDFPTLYHRRDGSLVRIGFEVQGVRRDGRDEPYRLEHLDNGVRIRMGSADVLVDEGIHDYEIHYVTTRQIGFFPDFDELYWNVTGNAWTLPIDHAAARIHLPGAARILRSSVYTGQQGQQGKAARVTESSPGYVAFETTEGLDINQGLTVAAAWPKGLVTPPSRGRLLFYGLRDNIATVVALGGFLLLASYYAVVYVRTRRRSPAVIVPLYEAPDGMSAPAVRYAARRAYDKQAFIAGLLELVAVRAMRIDKKSGVTKFHLLDGGDDIKPGAARNPLLDILLTKLFRTNKSFSRTDFANARFNDAQQGVQQSLRAQYDGTLFDPHRPQASRGLKLWLLYLVLSMAATWWQHGPGSSGMMIAVPLLALAVGSLTLLYGSWRKGNLGLGIFIFLGLFLLPFVVIGAVALLTLGYQSPLGQEGSSLLPLAMLVLAMRAYGFLQGYTEEGYRVMDQIEGFKRYLTLAEGPRLQALETVQDKLQVYERCLPYAVALDVGKAWAAGFAGLFGTVAGMAAVDAMQQYYGGHDILSRDMPRSVNNFTSDVMPASSSTSSSSRSPGSSGSWSGSSDSSSSGSSDSGSSGGGGGGGGGSGW